MSEIFPNLFLEKFTTHLYFKLSDYVRKDLRKFLQCTVFTMFNDRTAISSLCDFEENRMY